MIATFNICPRRWILLGLDHYRAVKEDNPEPIEKSSPSDIRRLLFRLLRETKALQLSYNHVDESAMDNLDEEYVGNVQSIRAAVANLRRQTHRMFQISRRHLFVDCRTCFLPAIATRSACTRFGRLMVVCTVYPKTSTATCGSY